MRLLLTTLLALVWVAAEACSSAVVARSASKEGGVILWKHRDQTSINDCRIAHFDDGRYAYTALINSYVSVGTSALAGVNEVGFGCISTATNHLSRKPAVAQRPDSRYNLMATALRECRTVDEFEQLLKRFKRGASFESNIGVGDAEGGAAYFEIWADGYRRYDVEQYDVRTNFSFAALNSDRGASERRYRTVHAQMKDEKMFSTADFIGYSHSFYSADKGDILADDKPYRDNNYTVPRRSSVASVAIVCSSTPRMDVIIGHPVAGISVPVWVAAGRNIPKCVAGRAMYDLGRAFTTKAYYTDGKRAYLNKNIARKALKINNDIKTPKRMPSDIAKFNAKIDAIFEKHRHQMLQVL